MNLNQFPQYRKYTNERSYFKILSSTELIEIQKVGKKLFKLPLFAKQFPEKQFIASLLVDDNEFITTCSACEFEVLIEECL